jgi:hypothetical protein
MLQIRCQRNSCLLLMKCRRLQTLEICRRRNNEIRVSKLSLLLCFNYSSFISLSLYYSLLMLFHCWLFFRMISLVLVHRLLCFRLSIMSLIRVIFSVSLLEDRVIDLGLSHVHGSGRRASVILTIRFLNTA